MPERSLELERKFSAPAGFVPDLAGLVEIASVATHELDAAYHDTLVCALADAGWSLRRRTGGRDDGWTLKRPTSGEARTEVTSPDDPAMPEALRQEVREVTGLAAVVPVARLRTRRRESMLTRDGVLVATLAQDAVRATTSAGDDSWDEVEVELEPGAPATLLDQLTDRLVAGGAVPAPHTSKVARALAAVPRPGEPSGPETPARAVLLAWAARQVGVLQALEAGVRTDEPDHVHKMRVATRRLRSLLKTFRPLFDTDRTRPLRAELRWLGAVLGEPRDAEVLREEFGDLLAELGADVPAEVRHGILDHLTDHHDRAHAALVAELDGARAAALRESLVELLVDPPLRRRARKPAGDVLPELQERAVREVAELREHARSAPDDLERWHEVRKAAKAVRYACEALADAIPGLAEEAELWEEVTESLGELQDTAVAAELIADVARRAGADPDTGVWRVLRDAQADRRTAAFAAGQLALAAVLDRGE
ncbi:MAG TPA: CYTH and CHAD domain-containing protein [Propionibacterium sp.]|nr:CYTH and CHAD domain-containing protein [Propionibacterium sp.]